MDYILVGWYYEDEFLEMVNEKIKEGYTPIGGVAIKEHPGYAFYQAMIKEKTNETNQQRNP